MTRDDNYDSALTHANIVTKVICQNASFAEYVLLFLTNSRTLLACFRGQSLMLIYNFNPSYQEVHSN